MEKLNIERYYLNTLDVLRFYRDEEGEEKLMIELLDAAVWTLLDHSTEIAMNLIKAGKSLIYS